MKNIFLITVFAALCMNGFSQVTGAYQKGIVAEEILKGIGTLSPYASGGLGFDNRYEGVRGSPRLSDTLLPSLLLIKGQKSYLQLESDIDLVQNSLIYKNPRSGQLFVIPIDRIEELIIKKDGEDRTFRTTYGRSFDKEIREERFIEILTDGKYQFIKMPVKIFVQSDYKSAYSADRRFDEFQSRDKYYLSGPDNKFYQIQLTKKAVIKLYPEKKKLIDAEPDEKSYPDKESMIISLIEKF